MSLSTKEKIQTLALSLFATNGYEATTMNQIADLVGVTKPAIYVYFNGKEKLFLSVFTELVNQYKEHMNQTFNATQDMKIPDKLYHIFEQYILYFARNPEISAFWNRVLLFPPVTLKEQIYLELSQMELEFSKKLEFIFKEGVNEGIIRSTSVQRIEMSYRCLREGLLMSFLLNPGLEESKIQEVWNDYWLGIGMNL